MKVSQIKNKEKVNEYQKSHDQKNVFLIDPMINKDILIEHFTSLDKQDRLLRFNQYMADCSIDTYIQHLINKKAILLGIIDNNSIIGLAEIIHNSNNIAEIATTVLKPYRKKHFGKKLLTNIVYYANFLNYEFIKIDFSLNNKVICKWSKEFNIAVNCSCGEGCTIFPSLQGDISKISNYKEQKK